MVSYRLPTAAAGRGEGRIFSFPNPVNEVSARIVAAGVVTMALAAIVFDARWLTVVLAYGFIARVLTGPTLSPLGQLVTRVVTPRLGVAPRLVSGPPKRFAQAIGVGIPSQLMSALPYLATIVVLVAISWMRGRAGSPAPASLGLAFVPDR